MEARGVFPLLLTNAAECLPWDIYPEAIVSMHLGNPSFFCDFLSWESMIYLCLALVGSFNKYLLRAYRIQ
jgi:hypothetical protein